MEPAVLPALALSLPFALAWAAWRFACGFAQRRYPEGDWARWALPGTTYNAALQAAAVAGQSLAAAYGAGDALRYAETVVILSAGVFALVAARDGAVFPLAAGTRLTPASAALLRALFCTPWIFTTDRLAVQAPWESWLHFAIIAGAGIVIYGGGAALRLTVFLAVSLCLWPGAAGAGPAAPAVSHGPESAAAPSGLAVSHAGLRREHIVMQSSPVTCGPAAAATLLNFYGIPATEEDVLDAIAGLTRASKAGTSNGFSMDTLLLALLRLGAAEAGGYRFPTLAALRAYQERANVPLIVHLRHPNPHFSVLAGVVDDAYVLADPAWGLRVLSETEMASYWSGAALVALPGEPQAIAAARATMARLGSRVAHRATFARLALGW